MPVSSSSGLDIDLVFINAAASSSSSFSSSSSNPWIPPRTQWPLPGEDDAAAGEGDNDDDGQDDWGPSTSASKSKWLTAMTSWNIREGDSSGARMAIATADGSVHFFTQEHQRASSPSKSPNRSRARSPSPTPSIASTRSGFHPRADSHAPPFAGFASHEGGATTQEHILSPTSPTSTNLASTAAWKPSSPEGSRHQGFDALESRLESQYHSGSAAMSAGSSATHGHHRGESVVGSFMESLGLSKSTGHHHGHHHASPSRSRRDSASAASASAEMSRTSSSSRTTGLTSSNTQLTPPPAAASPSSSRRHSHARSSAIIGSSSAMASLHAPGPGSGEEMKRSRSVSQATAGSNSRRREDDGDSLSANQSPAAPAILEKIRPYARLAPNGRDASQIVAMTTCCLSGAGGSKDNAPDTLLVLHRSGWMTAVDLGDGTVLGDVELASASPSTPVEHAPAAAAAAGGSTSSPSASNSGGNGGGGGGGLVASTLAALRSHSNSPSPSAPAARLQQQQQQQQQPTSRPGSASLLRRALTNEGGPAPSAASASQAVARPSQQQQQGKQRAASFIPTLHVIQSAESGPVAVCFDAAQKLLVFVALQAAPGGAAALRVVEAVPLPQASRERAPSFVGCQEGKGCCVAYLDEAREAVLMQRYEIKSGPAAVVKVSSWKLALPDSLTGSVQSCTLLDAKRMLVRTADESVVLLKIVNGEERLEVVKSVRVPGLEEVELVAGTARGAGEYALARTKASTRLLRIAEDDVALLEHEGSVDVATSLLCGSSSTLLTASASNAGLHITSLDCTTSKPTTRQLYSSTSSTPAIQGLLPLSMERILVLTSSGHLVMTTLNDLVTGGGQALAKPPDTPPRTSAAAPNARLTMFRLIANPTTSHSSSSSHRPTSSSHISANSKYILTTLSTGCVAFWDPTTLRLIAEWSLFTTPVAPHSLALFGNNDNTLRLHNCLALASTDGSLALIALDGLKLLYLIPGRGREAGLVKLAVRADELMLLYADGRARVWDVASMELRRSVSSEQAGGMLVDGRGSWSIFEMSEQDGGSGAAATHTQTGVLSSVQPSTTGVGMMRANLKRAIDAAYKAATNGFGGSVSGTAAIKDGASTLPLPRPRAVRPSASSATLGTSTSSSSSGGAARVQTILRPLMTALWPWGVDGAMDGVVKGLFDPPLQTSTSNSSKTGAAVVAMSLGSASVGEGEERRHHQVLPGKEGEEITVSGVTNATRFLALVSMLDVLALARKGRSGKEKDDGAISIARLTTWLSTTLPPSITGFAPLNPAVLALHLVDPTPSIRSAATLLLEKRIEGMDPQEVDSLVEGPASWRTLLPSASSAAAAGQRRQTQALSLSLIGFLCLKRYAALDPALLRDVAESVSFSLSPTLFPDHPGQQQQQLRLIALHLCVQGFAIWQNYVDAMALLRALFALAVDNGEQEGGEVQVAARQAVVQVAEEHAPLFMTTLNLDLLAAGAAGSDSGASSVATTSSTSGAQQAMRTMRLLTFLVGQRPNLLVASLPRIAEAVVKALDPTISASPSTTTTGNAPASTTGNQSSPKTSTTIPLATTTTQRDLLLPTATSLISSLVRTYRTLAFHGPTQRLAVGTHEGAIVMYELRSATRLFVLEGGHGHVGHHGHGQRGMGPGNVGGGHGGHAPTAAGPLTMLSFSLDGRRLVSLSLVEGKALAWKVGSSLASWLLRPGGVPRQGGNSSSTGSSAGGGTAGAEPAYKVWRFRPFVEGEEGVEEAGVDVRCDWVAEKRCEVEIVEGGGKQGKGRRERTLWDVE